MTVRVEKSLIRKFICPYSESNSTYNLTVKFVDNGVSSVTRKAVHPYHYTDSGRVSGASIIQFSVDHPSEFDDLITAIRKEFGSLIAERVLERAVRETTRRKK